MGSYLLFLSYFVWTQIKPDIVPALDDIKKKKKKKKQCAKKKKKKKQQCAELPQACLYMQINAFAHFDTEDKLFDWKDQRRQCVNKWLMKSDLIITSRLCSCTHLIS